MTSWIWRASAAAMAASLGAIAPVACVGPPTDEAVGKLGQRCFPGDFCEEGLTCVATPVNNDDSGVSLGTDGGQCFIVGESATFDSGAPDVAAQ